MLRRRECHVYGDDKAILSSVQKLVPCDGYVEQDVTSRPIFVTGAASYKAGGKRPGSGTVIFRDKHLSLFPYLSGDGAVDLFQWQYMVLSRFEYNEKNIDAYLTIGHFKRRKIRIQIRIVKKIMYVLLRKQEKYERLFHSRLGKAGDRWLASLGRLTLAPVDTTTHRPEALPVTTQTSA
ncbi:hypothetical protein E2C01_027617 [Portunus trituberculatus]|uniref:Uncharacterized protein n=1 Tax=Portunus trituberculatus TaxID=210409 RepID=A0A5B7EP69_PORTR|nr:hypothetical protein [Portunus trituberculatus]